MNNNSKDINEQIEFGLNSISDDTTIEIKLKDFMLIFKTFEEFNRFFHQPLHYSNLEDIEIYLGNKEFGAYSIIRKIYYNILPQYLPKEIDEILGERNDPFSINKNPYYFKVKNDININDGTEGINNRLSFVKYANSLLRNYHNNGKNWEVQRIDDFIENISRYAEDIDGYYKNMNFDTSAEYPTWRIFAQILKGATIYE